MANCLFNKISEFGLLDDVEAIVQENGVAVLLSLKVCLFGQCYG